MRSWNKSVNLLVIGTRIRQAREKLRLSQEELAAAVSKDQRAISEYENGKRKLSAADLPSFSKVLGVPLSYFYEGEITTDELDRLLLDEFQQLPNVEAKQAVIEIIRIFSSTIKLNMR
jgi:transcriptional regulator with XRE-family HTH domain